jgi:hypothetical protein
VVFVLPRSTREWPGEVFPGRHKEYIVEHREGYLSAQGSWSGPPRGTRAHTQEEEWWAKLVFPRTIAGHRLLDTRLRSAMLC